MKCADTHRVPCGLTIVAADERSFQGIRVDRISSLYPCTDGDALQWHVARS